MYSFTRFGRLVGGAAALAALLPAATLAQAAAPARQDSIATKDSAATHTAPGKRSRLGALGRAAAGKANSAANKIEEKTGISKETMAKAALAGTGVGAAAMLVKPADSSSSLTAKVGAAAGRGMLEGLEHGHADKVGGVGATPAGAGVTAQQMALYQQQQMAMAQMGAGQTNVMASSGNSAEMQRLQAEYMQIMMRAQTGDKTAAKQMQRFAQEWGSAAMRLQGVAPNQQQAAYEAAMRDALDCAMRGKSCKT